jgi:hypothetical protein
MEQGGEAGGGVYNGWNFTQIRSRKKTSGLGFKAARGEFMGDV